MSKNSYLAIVVQFLGIDDVTREDYFRANIIVSQLGPDIKISSIEISEIQSEVMERLKVEPKADSYDLKLLGLELIAEQFDLYGWEPVSIIKENESELFVVWTILFKRTEN